MADVNRTPFNIIPQKWAFDPEVGPFIRDLLDVVWQMRNRSGGDFDQVEYNDPLYQFKEHQNQTGDSVDVPVMQQVNQVDDGTADALATAAFANAIAEVDSRIVVPVGGIILWSTVTIPTGWQICNGTNGTPNLRNKFIIGAGTTYAVGAASAVDIAATNGGPTATTTVDNDGAGSTVAVAGSGHSHTITIDPKIPPYYAAYYIMRMK